MKVGVIIGRFQPFHEGHGFLLYEASKESDIIIVVLGSSNRSRSIKNPFTVAERRLMISEFAKSRGLTKPLYFVESPDNLYKEWSWKSEITRRVNDLIPCSTVHTEITLYGHYKDDSSYYLSEFPEWEFKSVENTLEIDATDIRDWYFSNLFQVNSWFGDVVPKATLDFLLEFKDTENYENIKEERFYFQQESMMFDGYPYPETLNFVCSDAVVICQGHVLLIQRKHAPGKGTWALPGGFKNNNETLLETCIRELKEETNLRVPEKVLLGSIKGSHMFDDPRRSTGIPRITQSYYFDLAPNQDDTLPLIRPASDAFEARWFTLSDVLSMNLFEDHLDIIRYFV